MRRGWTGGKRLAGRLAVLAIVSGLAGCSADMAAGIGPPDATGGASGGANAGIGIVPPAQAAFNPFSPDGAADMPQREVIANPTLAEVLQPGPLPEFSLGRADAPVVMVKYMSLTCPHCRRFMAETFPALKRTYIDTGKVRLIIREFPIGKSSGNATIALRCAPMDKYLALYQKFLDQQSLWVSQEVRPDAIHKVAAQVGVTRPAFDACLRDTALISGLNQVKERGRRLGIIGTPNFFIADRRVKTVIGMKEIREIVEPMLATR